MAMDKQYELRLPQRKIVDLACALDELQGNHQYLEALASDIRNHCPEGHPPDDCAECRPGNQGRCHETADDKIVKLLQFSWIHAANEMHLMQHLFTLKELLAHFWSHMDDHGDISLRLVEIIARHRPESTRATMGDLNNLLNYWLNEHEARYDASLLELIAQRMASQAERVAQ